MRERTTPPSLWTDQPRQRIRTVQTADTLRARLLELDDAGYRAYKSIQDRYDFERFMLVVDHAQGDPFAEPSRLRAIVAPEVARLPAELLTTPRRRVSVADFLNRVFERELRARERSRGSGKSGELRILRPGQEVLARTSMLVHEDGTVEARFRAGLPARGRSILGREAAELLCDDVPAAVAAGLRHEAIDAAALARHVEVVEDAQALRAQLAERGLVAFVADGAHLPRRSGIDDRPLDLARAVPFRSPDRLRVKLNAPNRGEVEGMGVPEGVTLLVGGGFHGKSTLLRAVERGVYDHLPGDGREYVVTVPHAVKVRAEDGRQITGTDIANFIANLPGTEPQAKNLPGGEPQAKNLPGSEPQAKNLPGTEPQAKNLPGSEPQAKNLPGTEPQAKNLPGTEPQAKNLPGGADTRHFHTENASGSTSQAAAIAEALEMGCGCLLLDEDTSATNFLIRDARVQALIDKEHEPITPFIDRVRQMYAELGVSTLLVVGGAGDYFDVADTVVAMRAYRPIDATEKARWVADRYPSARRSEAAEWHPLAERVPLPESIDPSRGRRDVDVQARVADQLRFGEHDVELSAVEQLVEPAQTRAIARALAWGRGAFIDGVRTVRPALEALMAGLEEQGLDAIDGRIVGDYAEFRAFELAAALNRLRALQVRPAEGDKVTR
jgi:predicted ABC-class ATPase